MIEVREARKSLKIQREHDEELVRRTAARIEQVRKIDPLEAQHVLVIPDMQKASNRALDELEVFANATRTPSPELGRDVRRPKLSDTRTEVKRQAIGAKNDVAQISQAPAGPRRRAPSAQPASFGVRCSAHHIGAVPQVTSNMCRTPKSSARNLSSPCPRPRRATP